MYVCSCKAVKKSDVERAVACGAHTPDSLASALGFDDADACGRCLAVTPQLLAKAAPRCAGATARLLAGTPA